MVLCFFDGFIFFCFMVFFDCFYGVFLMVLLDCFDCFMAVF